LTRLRHEKAAVFRPLDKPSRYKGAHGGRGSGKSHYFAEKLILKAFEAPVRFVCIREVQNTLRDSVHQLLIDKIQKFGLGGFFDPMQGEVRGANGSLIIHRGMQSYNAESIKSLEGYDGAWVEEAQSLSDVSWRLLRPTLRKEHSEIWCSWNPRHDTDAVDKFFRGANRSAEAIVVEANWNNNPWFPEVLRKEKDADYAADPEMADHVWGGGYEIVSEGAYYARLIAAAEKQGRIGHFPYDPKRKVRTSWDLGVDDYTAIWFWQDDGHSATVIDFYETQNEGAEQIISACMPELFNPPPWDESFVGWSKDAALQEIEREVPFKYDVHYFPHDIRMREWGHGARSRVESAAALGVKNIQKGVPAKPGDRVAAVRRILPIVKFNNTPRVQQGIKRLRRYRRKWNDSLQTYAEPERDDNTHAADAFGEYAVNCSITPPKAPEPPKKIDVRMPTLNELVRDHDRSHSGGRRI